MRKDEQMGSIQTIDHVDVRPASGDKESGMMIR